MRAVLVAGLCRRDRTRPGSNSPVHVSGQWRTAALSRLTCRGGGSTREEIGQQVMALFGQDGFGVKLYAFHIQGFVAHAGKLACSMTRE